MDISITTKKFYPLQGGSVVYADMLATAFSDLGHQVTVVTKTSGSSPREEYPYTLVRNARSKTAKSIAIQSDVLLQVESSWSDALPYLLRRKPWFPSLHRGFEGFAGGSLKGKALLLLELFAYRIGHTIGVSKYASQSWGMKGDVIENPYDDSVFNLSHGRNKRDIDVLFVGRITRDKGVFHLMDAIQKIPTSGRLNIAFIGGGHDLERLQKYVSDICLDSEVQFTGQLDSTSVADWMRRSRILAFPTTPDWLEASPLTILEAAACGCIVVASDIGGTKENIPPGHFKVVPGDVESLSSGLSAALETEEADIRQETQKFLSQRTMHSVAKRYLALFEKHLH